MAAPRTAAVATMSVTAAANHRSARSRGAARGKVQGIAGSMRIVDAPTQALWRRNIRATAQTARDSNRWPEAVAQRRSNKVASGHVRILPATDERGVN